MPPLPIEALWSDSLIDPRYAAELRRHGLPAGAAAAESQGIARLPILFCELHGGDRNQVAPILAAWTLLRYAARILDDIQDGDGAQLPTSDAIRLNVSTGLIFSCGQLLNDLETAGVAAAAAHDIRRMVYTSLLQTCSGQHLDLALAEPSLDVCWQIAGAKTGTFAGLICWCGGRVACADPQRLEQYRAFGYNLGLLDQIGDDLADLWATEAARGDLGAAARSLPVVYALTVLPPAQRARLLALLAEAAANPDSEPLARQLIIESGAAVYLTVQAMVLKERSQHLLADMALPPAASAQLHGLLDKATAAIRPT